MKVLKNLVIKNFLGTKDRVVDFDAKGDLLFITGDNASGKTTIMRAAYLAMTAEDAFFGGKDLDSIINDDASEMEITLTMKINGADIRSEITKKRGSAIKAKIFKNEVRLNSGELISEAKTVMETTFGNPLAIRNTYFMFSAGDDDFVTATDGKRLEIITKSSSAFSEFDRISENARAFIASLDDEYNALTSSRKAAIMEQDLNKVDASVAETLKSELEKVEKEIVSVNENLSLAKRERELKTKVSSVAGLDADVLASQLKKNETDAKIAEELEAEAKKIDAKVQSLTLEAEALSASENAILKSLSGLTGEEASLSSKIEALKKQASELVSVEDDEFLEETKQICSLKEASEKFEAIKTSGISKKSELARLGEEKKKMEDLFKHNKECPVCHAELTQKALTAYIETLDVKIDSITKEIEVLRNSYVEAQKVFTTAERVEKITKAKEQVAKLTKEIETLSGTLSTKSALVVKAQADIETAKSKLAKKKDERSATVKEATEVRNRKPSVLSASVIGEINAKLSLFAGVSALKQEIDELRTKLGDMTEASLSSTLQELSLKKATTNKTLSDITAKDAVYSAAKSRIEKIDATLTENRKKKVSFAFIRDTFGKNGIQKEHVEKLLAMVERETNHMIGRFFHNLSVKFTYSGNGIGMTIKRNTFKAGKMVAKNDVIKNFSDAQQEVLRVLLKLSFSRVIQYLNGTPLNLIFLNETFNTLSAEKEETLADTLTDFAAEYHLVFITHDLKLVSRFSSEQVISL